MDRKAAAQKLDKLYGIYNRREYVHPDPLEFLYRYENVKDREIAALIASSLAYGKVVQILKSVSRVLEILGEYPYDYLMDSKYPDLLAAFDGFVHRFARGSHVAALLWNAKNTIADFGSLNECFIAGLSPGSESFVLALEHFSNCLCSRGGHDPGHLVARPEKGSACKRMNLFLRWMVRQDRVDPGGWSGVPASMLIVPLDTHMHKIGRMMEFTNRKQANMITAVEVTSAFCEISPEDPVKYDFCLTRFGIRDEMAIESLGLWK